MAANRRTSWSICFTVVGLGYCFWIIFMLMFWCWWWRCFRFVVVCYCIFYSNYCNVVKAYLLLVFIIILHGIINYILLSIHLKHNVQKTPQNVENIAQIYKKFQSNLKNYKINPISCLWHFPLLQNSLRYTLAIVILAAASRDWMDLQLVMIARTL